MSDVIVIVGLIAGFALLALLVNLCDRIIGPDPVGVDDEQAVIEELDQAYADREEHRRELIAYAEHAKARHEAGAS